MENYELILKNKPIPKDAYPIIDGIIEAGGTVRFVIVGDLDLKGRYAETALIFTDTEVISYCGKIGEEKRLQLSELQKVESKRMYGNATLSALMPSGKREIFFRYT